MLIGLALFPGRRACARLVAVLLVGWALGRISGEAAPAVLPPTPAPTSLPLALDAQSAHQLDVVESTPGTWEIRTTGGDPYLTTQPFAAAAPAWRILSFECLCLGRIKPFQVFVGAPWNESRTVTAPELPYSEGWQTFALDLGPAWERAPTPPTRLRLDFGTAAGQVVQVRHLRLRAPEPREQEAAARRVAHQQEEAALAAELSQYLTRVFPVQLTAVRARSDTVEIEGRLAPASAAEGLWLAEVPVWVPLAHREGALRVARLEVSAAAGTFSVTVPRWVSAAPFPGRRDRLLTRWVVVRAGQERDTPCSAARYADEVAARAPLPAAVLRSKKGLGGFQLGRGELAGELEALGIDSVTVNLPLNRYLRGRPSAKTMPFTYGGRTFHADRNALDTLDRTLRAAAARGAVVLAIVLVPKAGQWDGPELGRLMQHPDCDPAGIFSMANVTSAEGVTHYAALMDFLAERYSRPDGSHGRIHHWIVHNEVDAGWTWTNCGEKPPLRYVDQYHKSMRLVHLIARQYDPGARAYISLTHYWTETASVRYIPSREVLRHLLAFSRVEGDFDWGIAYHPYPQSLREPKTWLDQRATFSFDTPLITFKNLEVLDAWVRWPAHRYLGRTVRSVQLSEQGPNSPDYSPRALAEQAAAMAYVWKKLQPLTAIEGFQFHNWIDNRHEGGLRIGLRRFPDDSEAPLGPKPVWHVYRALGTPEEDAACAFALPLIGLRGWDAVLYRGVIAGEP